MRGLIPVNDTHIKGAAAYTAATLVVLICGISLWVLWCSPAFTTEVPSSADTEQEVQNYQVLATVWRAQTTEVYQVVVINGLLEVLKVIVTGILAYVIGQPAAKALRSAAEGYASQRAAATRHRDEGGGS